MITIDGKQYHVERRQHTTKRNPLRKVTRGLTNKSIVQTFGRSIKTLEMTILVYLDGHAPNSGMGEESDLEVAFDKVPCSITDITGTGDYVFLGTLDLSRQFALVDTSAPFAVDLRAESYDI